MPDSIIRFVNLKIGEQPPAFGDWVMLRLVAPGRYDLFIAQSLAERLSRKAVMNLNGSIAAVAQAEHVARLAGVSVVYVSRMG